MKSTIRLGILAVAALAMAGPSPARAGVFYSDFGPGDTYNGGEGLTITGTNSGNTPFTQGATFTAGFTGRLSEIDVAFSNTGTTQSFDLGLYSDNGGQLGSLIESFPGNSVPDFFPGSIIAISTTAGPTLVAGTNYWLVASPSDPTTNVAWNENSIGITGPIYRNQDGSVSYPTDTLPAFRLIGTAAVPEPSSVVLCGIAGVVGLALARARRGRIAA